MQTDETEALFHGTPKRQLSRTRLVVIASWALGIAVAVGVFYYIALPAINRARNLDAVSERLCSANCHVLGHITFKESRYVPHGPSDVAQPLYLSGFLASYTLADGRVVDNVTLLTDIDPENAWLFASERTTLWTRHPIGSYVRCYYDRAHRDRASLNNDLDEQMAWQVALAITAALPAVLCVGIAAGCSLASICFKLRQHRSAEYAHVGSRV
ncbi:hypothetical protein pneo_cds_442 [Pandoravirus neocaledonia]|uniref:DUF3592 domain-containing protein n=1 Tax=Pandoravirus neocaledonia TaxID=2107708 RepID=A0A2U7UC58_9VIRU|nr:hypothetical protein pneo_cds_442 [Pandoravirus neocaledonia]AVK76049.1 hypothetical protein pneo_cds_442 [Pandoravirus neocaledonia]